MNQNRYRLVFNAHRGLLMAVAETSHRQGKCAGGESGAGKIAVPQMQSSGLLKGWRTSLALALALMGGVQAQDLPITPAGPAGARPILDAAANGVPIVHIAPPSVGGVSRNQFKDFNVNKNGLILNNSNSNVQTQLGGWITGNPQLGITPARIILNEVVGTNASQLRGTMEVAGRRADIVIANPNGLLCDACGFINTNRVTLTTGTPQFEQGRLQSLNVGQGIITIGQSGLNGSQLSQLDLLARGLVLEGEVWAQSLNSITGANQVLYGTLQTASSAGSGEAPRFAVDIKSLGGMYANQVYLVATEQGLGVNSSGRIAALTGTLQLSSNGDITLKDSYAKQDLSITGSKQVSLTGQTQSEAVLNVQAAGKLDQSGTLSTIGAGALLLNAASLNNTGSIIQQGQGPLTLNIAGEALNSGSVYSATNVSFTAGQWQDQGGVWQAQGKLDLKAGKANLADSHLSSGADTVLNIASLNANRTVLNSLGKLDANIAGPLTVANSPWQSQLASKVNASDISLDHSQLISLDHLSIQANTLTTSQSKIASKGLLSAEVGDLISSTGGDWLSEQKLQLSAGRMINSGNMQSLDVSLQSKGLLDNSGGTVQSQQKLQINSQELVNKQGSFLAGKDLTLYSSSLNNEQGKIASITAKTTIDTGVLSNTSGLISAATGLQIQSLALSNQAGEISSAANLNIDAQDLRNLGGAILAQDTMQLKTAALDNVQGRIIAQHDLQLNTQALTNTQGTLASADGTLTVDTHGQALSNTGLLQAKQALTLSSGKLDNHGLLAGQTLDINAANIDNSRGKLIAQDGLQIKAKDLVSDAGLMQAGVNAQLDVNKLQNTHSAKDGGLIVGGSLLVNASELNNSSGFIHSNQAQSLNVQQLNNQDGQLQSQADLTIAADAVANQGGRIQASALTLLAKNNIDNSSGLIQSQQLLDIASSDLNNQKGSLLAGQTLQLKTAALDNSQGKIASTAAKTTLNTAAINNEQGLIASATGTDVSSQALSNQGGEISSTADLNIDTHGQKLSNLGGSVLAQGKMRLATGALDNAQGRLLAQQNMQIDSAALSNAQGTIASVEGALSLDTHSQVLSNTGKLQAKLLLGVRSAKLLNQGLLAGSSIAIDSLAVDNSHGQLIAQDALKIKAGDVLSDAGLIQAGGNAQLDVHSFTNTHSGKEGGVLVGGQLKVNADDLDNHSGLIHSNLAQVLNVQQLNNQDGQLQSQSSLSLSAQKIDNQSGHIQAADLTIKTPNQLDNRLGTLQGVQKLQIESQQLLNQGGRVLSGQDLLLNTAAFDNSQGKIASTAGKVTLNADVLSNDKGLISSATGTAISSQAVSNKGGEISSAADVSLNTHGHAVSNMAGSILAQGKMQLDIAALDNAQGRIQAQQNLQLNSQEISNTQGTIASVEGAMRIDTHGNALSNQDGKLQAKQALDLASGKLDNHGLLAGQILTINSQNIDNSQGQLIALDALKINAGELLSDAGLIQAGGNAQLDVAKLQNTHSAADGGLISGGRLTVNTGELDNSSGQIYSKAAQTLNTTLLNNQAGQLQSQSALTINADSVQNQSGQIQAAALELKAKNSLDNNKGSIQSQQQLDIRSQSLSNQGGSLLAGQNLNLQTGVLDNSQGKIASTAGQTTLTSAALNNDAGLISSATGTQISSQALSNKAGEINSAADLAIDTHGQVFSNGGAVLSNGKMQLATGALDNADGRILAQQDLHISSQASSSRGTIASVEGSASVDTHGQALNNTGKLQAKLALDIQSGALDNHGLLAGQNIGLNTANIDNSRGQLIAQDALKINAGNLISDAGLIQAGKTAQLDVAKLQNTHSAADGGLISGGTLMVNTGELDNSSGQIYSKAAQTLNATLLNNQTGQLQSQGALTINADNVQNQSGQIQAAALALAAQNTIDNNKGSIQSQQQLNIRSQSLSNQGGSLLAGQNVNLQTGVLDNSQGKIASTAGQTNLTSAALNNDAGLISSATGTQISSQALSNKAGEINSAADLAIDTHGQAFSNGGAVLANGKMQLATGELANADGRILAQQDLHISSQGLSSSGTIASVEGNTSIDTHGLALSNTGKLQAKLALDIQSGQLDNHGLLAGQNVGVNAANIDNSRGQLIAQDALKINTGLLISDAGLIQSGKTAQLDVAKLQNTHSAADGGLISGGPLTVNTGELDNSSGQIYSKAAQTLNTTLLNNQSGQLQSQGALTINADEVRNQSGQIQAAALELKAKNSLDNNKGSIQSQQQLDISSQSLSNQSGSLLARQHIQLQTGALDNSQGKIASTAGQTTLTSAALNNDAGLISGATGTQISSQTLSNKAGEINSAADLNIDTHGQVFSNGGAVLANGKMQLATGEFANADGRILAQQDLHISSQAISSNGTIASVEGSASIDTHGQALSNTGKLQAKLALDTQSGQLNNHGLVAGQNIVLNSANIDNSRGQLIAQDALKINAGNFISDAGLIQAGKAAQLDVAKLQNTHSAADGGLISGGTLTVNTGVLDNSSGQIYSKAAQTLNTTLLNNQSGQLQSQNSLTINADNVQNQSGQIQAAALELKAKNSLDNNKGSIQSQQQVDISSQSLSNQGGSVLAGQNIKLQTGALDNSQGKIASTLGQTALTSAALNNDAGLISSATGTQISSHALSNKAGEINSAADLNIDTHGQVFSNGGAVLANGKMQLATGALDNADGRILAQQDLHISSQAISSSGTIASVEGSASVDTHGQVLNNTGKLQAKLTLDIQSGALDNHGLLAGQNIGVNAANIDNSRGQLIAQDALKINTGNLISDAGLMQAGKAAQLDVAKLQNTHSAADGGLISGGTLTVNTGELDNSSGQIYSKAAQTLNTTLLNNQAGQLQSQGALTINADNVQNQSGQIQATALELKAKNSLDNNKGSIQSQQQLDISSQSLSNQGGSLLAGQNINLQTGALDNSQGKIASTAGHTAITSADLNNQAGLISSAAGTTLVSQTIKNDGGEISSEASLAINTQGHALSNTGGSLLAKNGALNLSSAALDNSNGRILAKDQLALIAHGLLNSGGVIASTMGDIDLSSHNLNNQNGKIQADTGLLKIQTGAVNNSQTGLLAAKNIQLNMADLDNSQGQIIAVESISAHAGRILNQSGLIQAGSNININTQGHDFINTQSHFDQADLRSKQGLIAGGNLQLDAASLDNSAGYIFSGQSQNINLSGDFNNSSGLLESKSALNIKAQSLNNTQGALTALGDADIALSGVFANQGKLNIGGTATIKASALDNKNGRIDAGNMVVAVTQFNNGKGIVEASAGANINSNILDNLDGSIAAGTDLSLTINGNYTHQGVLQAKGDLALTSTHLVNQGKLISNHQTTITTGNLDNRGEISSLETTRINASGQLDNSGDGLIDGSAVRIDAGTINNTSRIYGDKLSIGAQTVNNRDTGVIAARSDLQLGAVTLNNLNTTGNQDGALIFSLGNTSIGGGLDSLGYKKGSMESLVNSSSKIEVDGLLNIESNYINNKNEYIKTVTESRDEVCDGSPYCNPAHEITLQEYLLDNLHIYVVNKETIRRISSLKVAFSSPAQIVAGGDMAIKGSIENRDSLIAAGNLINVTDGEIKNISKPGWRSVDYVTEYKLSYIRGAISTHRIPLEYSKFPVLYESSLMGSLSEYNGLTSAPVNTVTFRGESGSGLIVEGNKKSNAGYQVNKLATKASSNQVSESLNTNIAIQVANAEMTDVAKAQLEKQKVAASTVVDTSEMTNLSKSDLQDSYGAPKVQHAAATEMEQAHAIALLAERQANQSVVNQQMMGQLSQQQLTNQQAAHLATTNLVALETLTHAGWVNETDGPIAQKVSATKTHSSQSVGLVENQQANQVMASQAQMSDTAKVQLKDAQAAKLAQTSQQAAPKVQSMQLGQQGRVLTMLPNLVAPNNSLFKLHAAPNQRYLVETDPHFTNQRSFLSSDYFTQNLAKDPSQLLKRYGDGFFEQKLINDQILALTGRRFLSDYRDTESEFKSLMDAGVSFAKQYQLTPGVALSAEQMALLSTDMVWLTTQTVTLADGSKQDVLVPQVYLRRLEQGDLQMGGAVVSGRDIRLTSSADLVNSYSTILGDKLSLNSTNDVLNKFGQISGQQISIRANNDLHNQSGQIVGLGETSKISLSAGRDVYLRTMEEGVSSNTFGTETNSARKAVLQGADVKLVSGRNIVLRAADVSASQDLSLAALNNIESQSLQVDSNYSANYRGEGYLNQTITMQLLNKLDSTGSVNLTAGKDISLHGTDISAVKNLLLQASNVRVDAAKESQSYDKKNGWGNRFERSANSSESLVGGNLTAGNNLEIKAVGNAVNEGNIVLNAAGLVAKSGYLNLSATSNVEIGSIDLTQSQTRESASTSSGFLSSKIVKTYDFSRSTQAVGSSLSGDNINVQAGKDIKVNGSAIAATQDVQLLAGNDVKITAGTNSSKDIHDRKESKSGFFSGGGFGFTYGKQEQQTHTDADGSIQSQNRSLVGSEQGKLTIQAGNAVQVTGSDLSALAGDIALKGKQVTVDPGQDRHQSTETQTFKQSGITVAFSAPVLSALQAAQTVAESAKTAGESKDSRVKALSVGTAALAAKNGIDAAKAAAADPKSVSVSITYGESKSESTTKTSSISHSGSTLNAGGDIQISAVGDKASQLNVLGSEINAKGNITLKSDGDINLQSALDESEQHSKNSSSSWGAGVAISVGQGGASYGVTANGSLSRGHADGKDTAQQNSHINASKILTLESGNDTRVEGAVVSGNKIVANIGGDLKLASRQDTSQFDSKQSSVSASVTVGVGVSGSASISQDKMKSDYAAVTEQSGLFAGKEGFEIKVKKNTDLNGAVIASKSDDNTLSTGTLTQKDINNHAEYSASSIGIGGGFSLGGTEKKPEDGKSGDQAAAPAGSKLYDAGPSGVTPTAPVVLSAGDNGTSTTKSAIATAKITITDEAKQKELTGKTAAETIASLSRDTDGAQQTLANDFKPEKINELFSATKTFLQEGNTFMANRTAEADAAKKALDGTTASLKAEQAKPQDQQNQALIRQLDAQITSLDGQKTEADKWTPGGDYGRAMTALQAAVGGNVSGGATGLLQNASVAYLQSLGAEKIKDIADSFQTKKGEENQTSQNVRAALHAIASCAGAAASSSNCSSAAVGAASSVVINNVLSEIENTNADNMTASEKEKRKNLVGSIITGIVAATDGNAAAANNAAQIEMQNNMLANARQIDRIKQLAKGDKNKEVRLLAAACAQLKCTAGLAKDDPNYSIYSALESLGKTDALKGERELLAKQTDPVQLVYLGGSAELPTFGENSKAMALQDAASRNQLGTRGIGALQAVGGMAEIMAATGLATTCGTAVGCVAAGVLVTSGADNFHTGVVTAIKGKAENTAGAQIIQQVLGTNPETSELLYAAMQLSASPAAVSKLEKVLDVNKAWESAKILNAGEVTASGKGFISTQQITTQGVPAALSQAELTQLSKLSRLDTGQAGALRETVADAYFSRNGFTALDGKCGANCFDGVYFKGDQVIINEVKPLNANNSIKLAGPNPTTALPPQMSDQWITSRVMELKFSKDPVKMATAEAIMKAKENGSLIKMVSGVNGDGMTMVRLK